MGKSETRLRIEQLAKSMPKKSVDAELTDKLTGFITDAVMKLVEQLLQEKIEKMASAISVNPNINVPDLKIPAIKIPEIKIPAQAPAINEVVVNVPEIKIPEIHLPEMSFNEASEWEFSIFRHNNGLIDSIKAKRIE